MNIIHYVFYITYSLHSIDNDYVDSIVYLVSMSTSLLLFRPDEVLLPPDDDDDFCTFGGVDNIEL